MARVFADLNLLVEPEERSATSPALRSRIRTALKLGYELIALNTFIEETSAPVQTKSKKKSKTREIEIPPPLKITLTDEDKAYMQLKGKVPKVLNRITLVFSENSSVSKLMSKEVKAYDIIAVQPQNEKIFLSLTSSFDIDLISLNLTERVLFNLRRPQIKQALNHGISFEINYAPAIIDESSRRHTLMQGLSLVASCKGKNLILTSGANKDIHLRGPYDVANLGLLFGLTDAQSKDALSTNVRSLLLHAAARRLGKGVVSVMPLSSVPPEDLWAVKTVNDDDDREADVTLSPGPSKRKKIKLA